MEHPYLFFNKLFELIGFGNFAAAYTHVVYSWVVMAILIGFGALAAKSVSLVPGKMQNFFEINWASANNTSLGAKALNPNNGDFTFLKSTDSYDISSNQSLNITAFTNNKLSGNFTFAVKGGSITSIEATFTELTKK